MKMKQYLHDFLVSGKYGESDSAYLISVYNKIEADERSASLFGQMLSDYNDNFKIDDENFFKFTSEIAERLYLREYTVHLLTLICLTKRLREEYISRGIDLEIFENTVLDLKYKLEECKLVKGVVGTFVASWHFGFYHLTRFALGRLQFEAVEFGKTYEKDGVKLTPDTTVINIHIPRDGTPMDEKRCDESFAMAKKFFADEVSDPTPFVCHSWLLYPENKNILSKHSNTYKFMSRFDILRSENYKENCDLWRLFDTDEKNPEKLPTDTSLRRAYVEHLKRGGKTGYGYGVFLL